VLVDLTTDSLRKVQDTKKLMGLKNILVLNQTRRLQMRKTDRSKMSMSNSIGNNKRIRPLTRQD